MYTVVLIISEKIVEMKTNLSKEIKSNFYIIQKTTSIVDFS